MVIPKDGVPLVNSVDPVFCLACCLVSGRSSGQGSTRVAVAIVPPVITGDKLQMYPLGLAPVPKTMGTCGISVSSFAGYMA